MMLFFAFFIASLGGAVFYLFKFLTAEKETLARTSYGAVVVLFLILSSLSFFLSYTFACITVIYDEEKTQEDSQFLWIKE